MELRLTSRGGRVRCRWAALLGVAMLPVLMVAPPAHGVLLTFEDLPATNTTTGPGGVIHNGALTSLSSTIGGIGFSIRRRGGAAFDIIENNLQRSKANRLDFHRTDLLGVHDDSPSAAGIDLDRNGRWGRRSLDPFHSFNGGQGSDSNPFLITFNQPIHVFSILLGDFSGDLDRVRIRAFTNAEGTGRPALRLRNRLRPGRGSPKPFTQKHFSFTTALNILAVEIIAGSGFGSGAIRDEMSVYLDRLFFDPSLIGRRDLIPFLTEKGVFDENFQGDSFSPNDGPPPPPPVPGIPAPSAAVGLAVLLPFVFFRRRTRVA